MVPRIYGYLDRREAIDKIAPKGRHRPLWLQRIWLIHEHRPGIPLEQLFAHLDIQQKRNIIDQIADFVKTLQRRPIETLPDETDLNPHTPSRVIVAINEDCERGEDAIPWAFSLPGYARYEHTIEAKFVDAMTGASSHRFNPGHGPLDGIYRDQELDALTHFLDHDVHDNATPSSWETLHGDGLVLVHGRLSTSFPLESNWRASQGMPWILQSYIHVFVIPWEWMWKC